MSIELNHTIVNVKNKRESAQFLAELFNLPAPQSFGHFLVVHTHNGVSLDFIDSDQPIEAQHYAFLVSEQEFDQIFGKIVDRGLSYWADPGRRRANEINTHDGGRGVYFVEPSGHFLEIITRPYGSGKKS